jgi:choline/ethanolamine phosphotransferase
MTSRDPLRSSTNTINNNKKTNNYINNNSNYYNDIKSKLKTNQFVPLAETKIKEKLNEMQPVLTQSQLKNLDEHKYSSTGATLLDKYFQPYWRWLVEQMPLNLAPNLITVIGLIINVITSTILIIYCPNANEDPPSWALFLCAIGLFIYQSLDAIDGKQARRTNSSTPLGELFDHGCDSISTVFVTVAFCVTLKLGTYPWFMFLACFIGMMAFYTAHWQTYVTGTLKFDKMDVTEAQATIYAIYFLTSIFGDFFWSYTVSLDICFYF